MPVYADDTPPEAASIEPPSILLPLPSLDAMDAPRDYLSGQFTGLISNVDRFFGDDRHYEESNKSVLQLDITRVTGYQ